jgi:ketosteroid isomerase-like protein
MINSFFNRFLTAAFFMTLFFIASEPVLANETGDEIKIKEVVNVFCDRFFTKLDATAVSEVYAPDAKIFQKKDGNKVLSDPVSFQAERTKSFAKLKERGASYSTNIRQVTITDRRAEVSVEILLKDGNKIDNMVRYLSLINVDGQWKVVRHSYDYFVPGID